MTTAPSTSTLNVWTEPRESLDGISAIRHLFNRLDGMYPIRWRSAFGGPEAIHAWEMTWAEAFADERITPREVADGLRNCRRLYDWPPSLPEFLRACRPELDEQAAYHEAVAGMIERERGGTGTWSHPAIYWAAVRIGRRDILANGYQAMRGRWEAALRDVLAQGEWSPVPEPTRALPAPGQATISREEARRVLAELGATGALQKTRGHRDWIGKVLERVARGEPVPIAVARRAQEAAAETSADHEVPTC